MPDGRASETHTQVDCVGASTKEPPKWSISTSKVILALSNSNSLTSPQKISHALYHRTQWHCSICRTFDICMHEIGQYSTTDAYRARVCALCVTPTTPPCHSTTLSCTLLSLWCFLPRLFLISPHNAVFLVSYDSQSSLSSSDSSCLLGNCN